MFPTRPYKQEDECYPLPFDQCTADSRAGSTLRLDITSPAVWLTLPLCMSTVEIV